MGRGGRTDASEDYGQVKNAHPRLPKIFRQPNSPVLMVHQQRLAHASWAQRPRDTQAARGAALIEAQLEMRGRVAHVLSDRVRNGSRRGNLTVSAPCLYSHMS